MVEDVAGKGQQTTQQPTINRSVEDAMTSAEATAIVMVEARVRVGWQRHWRQRRQLLMAVAVDGGGGNGVVAVIVNNNN